MLTQSTGSVVTVSSEGSTLRAASPKVLDGLASPRCLLTSPGDPSSVDTSCGGTRRAIYAPTPNGPRRGLVLTIDKAPSRFCKLNSANEGKAVDRTASLIEA
jgi:hypothetical protein